MISFILLSGCGVLNRFTGKSADGVKADPPANTNSPAATDSHAYALLFDLVGDEKDVSKLRFIKHERPELKSLLQEIAKANRDAYVTLEKFAKQNPQFNIKDKGLPPAEVEARNAISKFKENAILHSKDKDLEVHLLLSENEALTYGAHLASTVARTETDPQRRQFVQQLSANFLKLQQRVIEMLLKNYSA